MVLPSNSLETVAERADALRSTLGSLYLEGLVLDARFSPLMAALGARVDHAGAARFSV